jgi:hypothetical protein
LPASGANFLGNINTFFLRFQKRYKFGDELTRLLGFEVTSFFRHLSDDSLLSIETLFWARCWDTGTRSAKLSGYLFTFSLGCVFEDGLGVFGTSGDGPFATLLLSSVSLSDIFAFLFKFLSTFHYIILDLMFMVPGFAVGFINGFTFFFTFTFANERSVAEFDGFFFGVFLIFDETRFSEGLFAFFLLLGFEIGGVGGVAFLTIAMFASDDVIIFGLFLHNNFVDASLSSVSNGSNT